MGIFGSMMGAGFGMAQDPRSMQEQDPRIGQAMKGPGLFGSGKLADIFSILGDGFSGTNDYMRQMQQRQQDEREDQRWQQRFDQQASLKQAPTPSSAAKMAVEAGLTPGTPAYQAWIRKYAFSPKFITVGNAQGGEDTLDVSGPQAPAGLPQGYDPNQWEVVE